MERHAAPNSHSEQSTPAATQPESKSMIAEPADSRSEEGLELVGDMKPTQAGAAPAPAAPRMIGTSRKMRELEAEIARASRSNHIVLIKGESGTGKTTAASLIHEQSARAEKAFVDINCATIPEALLESELFGYEKGAFTGATAAKKGLFELADGGTLFLDEIAEMKFELQAKLLKAIEQKKIRRLGGTKDIQCDVRIIAASSRNLQSMVKQGTFREDLFYRLAVLEVHAAALRERRADIPALIRNRLVEEQRLAMRSEPFVIEEAAVKELVCYDWPGNIRQLHNVISRLATHADAGAAITRDDVRLTLARIEDSEGLPSAYAAEEEGGLLLPADIRTLRPGESLEDFINRVQWAAIKATRTSEGNLTRAARRLNYTRTSLLRLMKRVQPAAEEGEAANGQANAIAA